ncbi:hypothetical protein G4B88_030121 [Cannabis sativa]|uniref:Uncharacterized protein n=1 Tax=Cannabis sativa TaxID=3483 RepID=A0A7J6EEQ5_CANSA|nr:hypothetical protein G4B88_030121 [Cannabis sativa]
MPRLISQALLQKPQGGKRRVHYLSNTKKDGKDDHCEKIGWKILEEYNPDQRRWKYLSDIAEGSSVHVDDLSFEDEQENDEDYYPSLPFAALYSCFKEKGLKVTCLLCYCSEGDNIPDAFNLAEAACKLLGFCPNNLNNYADGKWLIPFSWGTLYGPAPDMSIF